ncbi:uncharacterized protein BXZ73DRAFT_107184 [Epithele typhae]|uniref:uncharacterized protein n=1 Tax=Epithele typhae TaxID=378194 RepID=UPI002007E987|nr:uncharacterized protein BXZ73DRAFT_107184 [Epithele typhae]KAH9912848.1 hypothetical protein BXZ73DRAFT_107184 [Epithele typhae]
MALIMTAVKEGAVVANHVQVTSLDKKDGKLSGAKVRDVLTGKEFNVSAKGIVNATGPFSDSLLTMDNPDHKPIVQPSSGTHITLPNYYSPRTMGLLDPATSDGTTDTPAEVSTAPRAQEEEIRWILEECMVRTAPARAQSQRGEHEGLVRNHMIHVSESGLLTIAGGKWTTYRAMAEETVDKAIEVFNLKDRTKRGCVTEHLRLIGSDGWSRNMFIGLVQRYGLETEVAKHLSDNYGDCAWTLLSLAQPTGKAWPLHGIRLYPTYPFIEAEVRYACRYEYAETAIDVIARRCRLSFLNAQAALDALPRVVEIMAEERRWPRARVQAELAAATEFLGSMGLMPGAQPRPISDAPHGVVDTVLGGVGLGKRAHAKRQAHELFYSRAQFDAGEVERLRGAFAAEAEKEHPGAEAEGTVAKAAAFELVKGLPGFEGVKMKDYEYVLEEAGFTAQKELVFDDFVEICAELRECCSRHR